MAETNPLKRKCGNAVKVGIIGGSGLDDPDIITDRQQKLVETPYGKPSDALIIGTIAGVDCILLARHDRKHSTSPSQINYRANIYALWKEGCTHIVATTACGSLQEHIHPGDIVILDQFIDRTYKRECTFYDGGEGHLQGVCHTTMAKPFCEEIRQVLIETVKSLSLKCHEAGTVITVEGPRFSSRAESFMFRMWNGDVINMTSVPEVVLAKELGLLYAAIALPTDYDCWKDEEEEHVSAKSVIKTFAKNALHAKDILLKAVPKIASMDWTKIIEHNKAVAKDALAYE